LRPARAFTGVARGPRLAAAPPGLSALGVDRSHTEPLPEVGTVESYTVVHVGAETFSEDTPYVSAVVDFGPVELTGIVRGKAPEAVGVGDQVTVTVETRTTTDDRLVVFRPA